MPTINGHAIAGRYEDAEGLWVVLDDGVALLWATGPNVTPDGEELISAGVPAVAPGNRPTCLIS